MLNFEDKDLYAKDKKKFDKFRNHILVKASEKDIDFDYDSGGSDNFNRIESSTIVDSPFDFDDGGGGFGGFGGFDDDSFGGFGDDSFGGFGGGFDTNAEDEKGITTRGNLSSAQDHLYLANKGRIFVFLTSPFFLFWYIILHISRNNMKVHDWKNELELIKKINIVVILISVLFMILGVKTIIDLKVQLVTGIVMFTGSFITLKYLNGGFKKAEKQDEDEINEEDSIMDFDGAFSDDTSGFSATPDFFDDEGDLFDDIGDDDDELFEETSQPINNTGFGKSLLNVKDDDVFDESLFKVFKNNDRYTSSGLQSLSRKELVNSFAPYLATNFTNFGEWKSITERSWTYNNIAYTIFLGLEKISPMIGKATIDKDTGEKQYEKMIIHDMKENTMMYKIQIEIPTTYKINNMNNNLDEFRTLLKKKDNDYDTKISISAFGTGFVIKLYKPIKGIISIGDLLRYVDPSVDDEPTTYEEFIDEKKGLPMLMGLVNSEYPIVIDYEDNTSGVIVGGSGSGKSWFTFSMLFNILIANDYHNVQMMIFDKKNAPFWNQYALSPHVIGYHTKVDDLRDIVDEVYAEITRRKDLLNEVGAENFKGLRKTLRKKNNIDELKRFPLLLFIVDEITSTMGELEEKDDNGEEYKYIKSVMSKITQEGRSLGVRMLAIGQRSIDKSVPKNVMGNSSFKFGMKLDTPSDYVQLDMDKFPEKPDGMGVGIMKTMTSSDLMLVKTLGVGGTSDEQILSLLRVIGLEWTRRSLNDEFIHETTDVFKVGYNRDKFREKALDYLRAGTIINPREESPLKYDIDSKGYLKNKPHLDNNVDTPQITFDNDVNEFDDNFKDEFNDESFENEENEFSFSSHQELAILDFGGLGISESLNESSFEDEFEDENNINNEGFSPIEDNFDIDNFDEEREYTDIQIDNGNLFNSFEELDLNDDEDNEFTQETKIDINDNSINDEDEFEFEDDDFDFTEENDNDEINSNLNTNEFNLFESPQSQSNNISLEDEFEIDINENNIKPHINEDELLNFIVTEEDDNINNNNVSHVNEDNLLDFIATEDGDVTNNNNVITDNFNNNNNSEDTSKNESNNLFDFLSIDENTSNIDTFNSNEDNDFEEILTYSNENIKNDIIEEDDAFALLYDDLEDEDFIEENNKSYGTMNVDDLYNLDEDNSSVIGLINDKEDININKPKVEINKQPIQQVNRPKSNQPQSEIKKQPIQQNKINGIHNKPVSKSNSQVKQNTTKPKTTATRKKSGGLVVNPSIKTKQIDNKPMTKMNKIKAISRIKEYIVNNGEGKLLKKKILKSELHENFNSDEISYAIDNGIILSEGDYFRLVSIG